MHLFASPSLDILRPSASAASILLLFCGAAQAQSASEVPALTIQAMRHPSAATAADGMVLKRLPAGKGELTFRGENATRTWTFALGRTEAARTSTFQLAMLNAVSVLPERSAVKLTVNGTVVATIPAASPDKMSTVPVKIPTGLLVPGLNTVQISTTLTHRVDCSIRATYELWALLDPARTGFLVPSDAAFAVRTLDDLAIEPLAEDGTTRIHLRMAEGADPAEIGQAGHLVEALVSRATLPRPIVDVGPGLGEGAGFDVVLDRGSGQEAAENLRIVAKDDLVTIGRDASSNRLVVILSEADGNDLDRRIAALATPASPARREPGTIFNAGTRRTFTDLGQSSESFTGRHYTSTLDVDLPADFYQANDRARLLIDGAHSAALVEGSELVFRVNGTLVSSLPLAAGRAERFQHAEVELPLRFFHPGHNELTIEGKTSAFYDQQCDLFTMPRDVRLSILGSTELEFPAFAHLGTMPQIPGALAYDRPADGRSLHLYLPDADRGSIGAGLTLLANMAATQEHIDTPVVHLGSPAADDAPGLVIATASDLPAAMRATLSDVSAPAAAKRDGEAGPKGMQLNLPETASDPLGAAAASNEARFGAGVRSAVEMAESLLRSRGFFFPLDHRANPLPATASSLLLAAMAPDAGAAAVGGVELPRFMRDPAQWLVVAAPNAATYEAGIRQLVSSGAWKGLAGQAVSFALTTETLRSVQPAQVAYVLPSHVVLSDVRPILGGVVSNNITLSIALIMLLLSTLGVSTHLLIRRMGAK